jgi:dipeptide/tripeptide permease
LYSEPDATSLFFWYSAGTYLSPLLGGYIADAFLGKLWTIISFSMVYIAGAMTLTIAAALGMSWLAFVGLVLIALGTGGIKPCVAAFGAQQFQDPAYSSPAGWSNAKLLETYFAAFYMSINFGSIASYILMPIARKNGGFGAAFGMATAVLVVSLLAFMLPIRRYVKDKPQGSILASVLGVYAAAFATQARRAGWCWCCRCLCCRSGTSGAASGLDADDDTAGLVVSARSGDPAGSDAPAEGAGSAGGGAGVRAAFRAVAQKAKAAALPGRSESATGASGEEEHLGDEGELGAVEGGSGAEVLALERSESLTAHEDGLAGTADGGDWSEGAAMRGGPSATGSKAGGASTGARRGGGGGGGGGGASASRRQRAIALRRRAGCLNSVRGRFTDEVVDGAASILAILPVFGIIALFWALYDQQGNTWVLQAKKMDLGPFEPDQLGALNPLLVLALLPLYRVVVIPCLERAGKCCPLLSPTPLRRMGVGMILAALTFLLSAAVEWLIEANPPGTVSVAWQLPQWVLITVAELFLSVTGLEWAYTQADKNLQGVCMAAWFFSNSLGDLLGAVLYQSTKSLTQVQIFLLCAGLMVVASGVYAVIALFYQPRPTDDLVNSGAGPGSAAAVGDGELRDDDMDEDDDGWWDRDGRSRGSGPTGTDSLALSAGDHGLHRGISADSRASIGTDYGTSGGDLGSVSGISMQHLDD